MDAFLGQSEGSEPLGHSELGSGFGFSLFSPDVLSPVNASPWGGASRSGASEAGSDNCAVSEGILEEAARCASTEDLTETVEKAKRHLSMVEYIERDVDAIAASFKLSYSEVRDHTQRPNVLVCGATGAGKSSLINTVFGERLAQEGAGEPVTTHFTQYAPDDANIIIYDSRGLEAGNTQLFIDSTKEFFELHSAMGDLIHVVWYVVNGACSRIQEFEKIICEELFSSIPIVFIINKADISSDDSRKYIHETISGWDLPSCVGIFDMVSGDHTPILNVQTCSFCGSDDIEIRKSKCLATCCECEKEFSIAVNKGDLITKTLDILPDITRECFIAAQTISCVLKDRRAKEIIREYYDARSSYHTDHDVLKAITRMFVRLSILWDFREHGKYFSRDFSTFMNDESGINSRVFATICCSGGELYPSTAGGALWNRCLRTIFIRMFFSCADTANQPVMSDDEILTLTESTFEQLNDKELNAMIDILATEDGLEKLLDREMPRGSRPVIPPPFYDGTAEATEDLPEATAGFHFAFPQTDIFGLALDSVNREHRLVEAGCPALTDFTDDKPARRRFPSLADDETYIKELDDMCENESNRNMEEERLKYQDPELQRAYKVVFKKRPSDEQEDKDTVAGSCPDKFGPSKKKPASPNCCPGSFPSPHDNVIDNLDFSNMPIPPVFVTSATDKK